MPKRKGAFVLFDPSTSAQQIVATLMAHHNKIASDKSITADVEERSDVPDNFRKGEGGSYADRKNKKYKLNNPTQVRAAASYWGDPKNRAFYSQEDQTTISKRIAAAEKKFKIGKFADK